MNHEASAECRFKVGDVVKNGLGREYTIISLDGPTHYPLVAKTTGLNCAHTFTLSGQMVIEGPTCADLIPPKRTRTVMRWANIYPNSVGLYDDEKVARGFIGALERGDIIAVAVPVTFEVEY